MTGDGIDAYRYQSLHCIKDVAFRRRVQLLPDLSNLVLSGVKVFGIWGFANEADVSSRLRNGFADAHAQILESHGCVIDFGRNEEAEIVHQSYSLSIGTTFPLARCFQTVPDWQYRR